MPSSLDGASLRAPLSRLSALLLSVALALTAFVTVAPRALAAPSSSGSAQTSSSGTQTQQTGRWSTFDQRAAHVLRVAARQHGDPYRYGAAGPNAFDCSGLVMYVFQHAIGKSLPHNAEMQYRRSQHISRRQLRRGDLVFQVDGSGYAFHVGIYAGHGYMWDAPHSGARVHRQKMWHARWRFGRLIHRS